VLESKEERLKTLSEQNRMLSRNIGGGGGGGDMMGGGRGGMFGG